jgi:hypothetical protein
MNEIAKAVDCNQLAPYLRFVRALARQHRKEKAVSKPDIAASRGPTYHLNIEGVGVVEWHERTITTEQLINLAGWEPGQQVLLVDADNNERTLAPGEVIELQPGQGFAKKFRWKRG